jgi:hypothetical protein
MRTIGDELFFVNGKRALGSIWRVGRWLEDGRLEGRLTPSSCEVLHSVCRSAGATLRPAPDLLWGYSNHAEIAQHPRSGSIELYGGI